MITISGFKWVPPFARGQVRDLRVRWACREAGLPYRMRLIDMPTQGSPDYRAEQPFGQVPVMEEGGRILFETGAILLDIAGRSAALLPREGAERDRVMCWIFAALNSIEPYLMNLAEVDFFMADEAAKAARRPRVVKMIEKRLAELEAALGDGAHLAAGGFTIADLLMTTVLRILGHTDMLDAFPKLAAYKQRGEARPAFQAALAEQLADFERHGPADMKYER